MSNSSQTLSGKGAGNENFPVASALIAPRHRALIMAFYRFARAGDDVADHPDLPAKEKLRLLDGLESTVLGKSDDEAEALPLRAALAERAMSPRHALDLLTAFRLDVTKQRYETWDELMDYCQHSAAPVGRFVLDVHGESEATWPANDALCAALQVINHLQDCGKDYHAIDRVYVPREALAEVGLTVDALGETVASPDLRRCLAKLTRRTAGLLERSAYFSSMITDGRLALEVAVIQRLAETLVGKLMRRDPLSQNVHLDKLGMASIGLAAAGAAAMRRLVRRPSASTPRGVNAP